MSELRALQLIRNNIRALLTARKENQTALAFWMQKDKSWINKFLNGTREIQLKDLDRIADFFGIATYQLFQPGISALTERRAGYDRRSARERRIGHQQRMVRAVVEGLGTAPRHREASHEANRTATALRALITDFDTRLGHLLSEADAGRQTAPPRADQPTARARRRAAGGSDAPKT